jgi:hypothetical protein
VTVTYYTKGYTQVMHSIYVKKLKLDENLHKHRSFCLFRVTFAQFLRNILQNHRCHKLSQPPTQERDVMAL